MQTREKPHLTDKFQQGAGLLLLHTDAKERRAYKADEISHLLEDGSVVNIRPKGGDTRYYRTNFDLLFHFWQRALIDTQSYDLRPICSLDKSDELYKTYLSKDLSDEDKAKLAARVKVISPNILS
jgi:hypothetical protein